MLVLAGPASGCGKSDDAGDGDADTDADTDTGTGPDCPWGLAADGCGARTECGECCSDTDFDPLVEYLQAAGVACKRVKSIAEIARTLPKPRAPTQPPKNARAAMPPAKRAHSDKLAPIIKQLHSLSGKPGTRKKLAQTISNYFRQHGGALADNAIEQLIEDLIRMKYVTQNGTKVTYHLS